MICRRKPSSSARCISARDAISGRRSWNVFVPAAACIASSPGSRFRVRCRLPGTKIQADGRDIGEITSVASLPVAGGERSVALGYIRREVATPGKQFQLGNTQLSVAALPFSEIFRRENP